MLDRMWVSELFHRPNQIFGRCSEQMEPNIFVGAASIKNFPVTRRISLANRILLFDASEWISRDLQDHLAAVLRVVFTAMKYIPYHPTEVIRDLFIRFVKYMCVHCVHTRAKDNSTRTRVSNCRWSAAYDFVTRVAAPQNRAFTIRNTRNYATSEKVKSRGKFAVGAAGADVRIAVLRRFSLASYLAEPDSSSALYPGRFVTIPYCVLYFAICVCMHCVLILSARIYKIGTTGQSALWIKRRWHNNIYTRFDEKSRGILEFRGLYKSNYHNVVVVGTLVLEVSWHW